MSRIDHGIELATSDAFPARRRGAIRFLLRHYPLGAIGAAIVGLFVFVAVFAPFIAALDPLWTDARLALEPPSASHWLGADFMGRDVYSRLVYGARISLLVGCIATLIGCSIGVLVGLLSAYLGGWVDLIVQRIIEVLQALPLFVMALV